MKAHADTQQEKSSAAPDSTAIARLRAHPRFPEAAKYIAEALTEIYEGNRIMNTMLNERARGQIGYLILMMQWASSSQHAAQGVTMARMKAACTRMNYCSPNRVESIMAVMRLFGYIRLETDPYDHRVKVIVPTEKLIGNYVERWRRHFHAMTLIMPEGETGLAALKHEHFAGAFVREISREYSAGLRVANASREIDTFLDRNCGMMILLFLVSKGVPDETITGALRATVSISGLARRFGVSRPHVRKLLADAEAEGLVGDATGETPIRLLPRAIEGFEKFYASTFLTFAQAIRAAAQEMEDIQG
jgi:hypothetical protein